MWGTMFSGYDGGVICKTDSDLASSAWGRGTDSSWQETEAQDGSRSSHIRRLSITSDSGDTGIGTSCSDSVEDHSSSSAASLFQPIRCQTTIPTAHVMPSTCGSSLAQYREANRTDYSKLNSYFTLPGQNRNCGTPEISLDMKDYRPVRKWSSLSKLSDSDVSSQDDGPKKEESRNSEGLLRDSPRMYPCKMRELVQLHQNMGNLKIDRKELLKKEPVAFDSKHTSGSCSKDGLNTWSYQERKNALDMTFSALPESKPSATVSEGYGQRYTPLGHQSVSAVTIQPAVRTQMWLTEQMHSNPVDFKPSEGPYNFLSWQSQPQQLGQLRMETEQKQGSPRTAHPLPLVPVYPTVIQQDLNKWESMLKLKDNLLRQKEVVIDRQKQQISQLHQKIRENELHTQQVILGHRGSCENHCTICQQEPKFECAHHLKSAFPGRSSTLQNEKEELRQKLVAAEQEVLHISEYLKQSTHKYSEEIKKLEEKLKIRDKNVISLKKKYQKESEQNQEKQQRIETLEKYLADLPTLDDVQNQTQQLQRVEDEKKKLEEAVSDLELKLGEARVLIREKEVLLECQNKKEKELVSTVQSSQQKVEKCLEDGIRLPMLDVKQLHHDTERLKEQSERANKVIDNQQKRIDQLVLETQVTEERLQQEKQITQDLRRELAEKKDKLQQHQRFYEENSALREQLQQMERSRQPSFEMTPLLAQLFKEMSHCLFDLRALCSILTQRAQGKEPNLSLLLGIQSMSCPSEENENYSSTEMLAKKLSDVRQLRKDIDDLRTTISDRYAQDMGDSCITQ
ncbi:centrosomal protein of 85 kDa-like [Protopterus annectens]|uniref:centrosomal protein of 85 kDa-like n=1 Tax=Protopterus annectens TaxID=7888 RepID=UPI001CF9E834|nr:centrosomal protein of 85 kDa-like [Protopterus annectens]